MKRLFIIIAVLLLTSSAYTQEKTKMLRVPDVIGLKSSSAKLILENAGFKTAAVIVTEKGNPGSVIQLSIGKKTIKPWSSAKRGTMIYIGIVKEELVSVPGLTGKTVKEAEKILKSKELRLGNVKEKATTEAEPGIIIQQIPEKGTDVEKEKKIDITLAKPVMVKVPDLMGKSIEKTREILAEKRLLLGTTTEKYSDNTPGTVIEQNPAAELEVVISSKISIVTAKEKKVSVPTLRGKTTSEARDILRNAGLQLGQVTEQIDSYAPVGTIIKQSPYGFNQVSKDSEVDIVIAKRDMIDLPSVIGLKEYDASRILRQLGFQPTIQKYETDKDPAGIVLKMSLTPGKYEKGTRLILTISREKPKPVVTPTVNASVKKDVTGTEKRKYPF